MPRKTIMNRPFRVHFVGSMHTDLLYNSGGELVYTISEAVEVAEWLYGNEWAEVYNGDVGEERFDSLKISP